MIIKLKSYIINNNLSLTNQLLESYISTFWNDIFNNIKDTNHLMLMCKVQFEDSSYRTLGHLRKVNFSDKELFIDYLLRRLSILTDSYMSTPISKITFSYIIKSGQCTDTNRELLQDLSNQSLPFHNFNNMVLPISMDPSDYGEVLSDSYHQLANGETIHRFMVNNSIKNHLFKIDVSHDEMTNHVTILGNIDLEWLHDTKVNESSADMFKREIRKSTIYFMDGVVVLRKQQLTAKPFRKLVVDPKLDNDFYTLDMETNKGENGKLIPYLICAYNGQDYISSFGSDQKKLFSSFFNEFLSKLKNSSTTIVYAHNFSGFDGIFLMKHLLSFGKVEPLLFNGKLMSIKLKVEGSNKSDYKIIIFRDSFLLLPLALRALCKAFDISIPKSYFPFKLTNIIYKGVFPKFEFWTGISLQEYELLRLDYKNKFWNYRDEAIKYCKIDCQSLHEVLVKFNELIFKEFQVNIHKCPTLPSLAMRIYKTHYMPKDSIYQMLGKVEWAIRQSYSGGAVDVYIPHNRISAFFSKVKPLFRKLYSYDVNSLYPFVMSTFDMPIGLPTAFKGNIRLIDPQAFGFFYCKITSPEYIKHPLLQRRIKTSEGVRTIAGLGSWTGWISSVEMDNAIKYGYLFEIIKGYQFERGDVFSGYVNRMYELRMHYFKGHPMNLIAKLLMNSLYGKFGMKTERTVVDIFNLNNEVDNAALRKLLDASGESIQDYIELGENKFVFIRNTLSDVFNEDSYHGSDVNIAIASTITAGARVHMSIFKNNPNFNLYYSDTDSSVIDQELPEFMVGSKLGQMKLEHTINKAIFLAPKVYALEDVNGNETIKIKGVTDEITSTLHLIDLEQLLVKDSNRVFTQHKWYKSLVKGEINITDVLYNLKVTSNKRNAIYKEGVFNTTEPLFYDEIVDKENDK